MDKKIIDNRYVPIREIGSGGFASVMKAWATNLEKFVAVKKVHESFSKNARFLDMFRVEAVNTAKLDHPNIVRVIDFLKTPANTYYIVMEYVKGADLRQLIVKCAKKKVKLPFAVCAYIVGEILKALEFAYSHVDEITGQPLKIVHRDISPGNIMVFYDGRVKLGDFGIAKVSSSLSESYDAGRLKGKVPYMSPEQAEGTAELDNRSDIFSIGIVMYELLTGKKLFEAGSEYDTWKMVRKVKFNPHSLDVHSNAPGPLKQIVLKALSRERHLRYSSSLEMLKDITNYLGSDEYNIQKGNLQKFLAQVFAEEIELEDKETEHPDIESSIEDLNLHTFGGERKKAAADEHLLPPAQPSQVAKSAADEPLSRDFGGERTVIDFVLDTAKKYEKLFLTGAVVFFAVLLGLFALDVYFSWTNFGTGIHDKIWPPALVVDSYPTGASIKISDSAERNILDPQALTPLKLEKIAPGNYTMSIGKQGFNDLLRKITIVGSRANISGGSASASGSNPNNFIVRLETKLNIDSNPSGAGIFVDGKSLPQKTPVEYDLEAGKHFIALEYPGFDSLGSTQDKPSFGQCIINLADPVENQPGIDSRFWAIRKSVDQGNTVYSITGTFWKKINLDSNPQGADVFANNDQTPLGKTPLNDVPFKVGHLLLDFKMQGFKTVSRNIVVGPATESSVSVLLNKIVRFNAYGEDSPSQDINARVSIAGTEVKNRVTPFEIDLPLRRFEAVFAKEPRYKNTTQSFNPNDINRVSAKLALRNPLVKLRVRDELTMAPVAKATIILNGKYIGVTDASGEWKDYIPPGEHTIKIDTNNQYPPREIKKSFEVASEETITVNLAAIADGSLIIDTHPHFVGAQIYVNGKFEGETVRRISNLPRGSHKVSIRHFDLAKEIEKTVNLDSPNKTVILRISPKGEFIESNEQK